jgi:chaperonin GroEL
MPKPAVILPPRSRLALQRGVDSMVNLIRGTLGPKARAVAVASVASNNRAPEILDDGATIARRVVELPDPLENMGAMLIRQITWNTREEVGDGATSAAVIAQAILSEANRYAAAGGNVMRMKTGAEKGLAVALAELDRLSKKIEDPDDMASLITGVTSDPDLGAMFGEIFDIIGPDGVVIVQDTRGMTTQREYVEGLQWDRGYLSPYMITNEDRREVVLEDAVILLTDRDISTSKELLPILEQVRQAGFTNLLIIANDVTGEALALLVVNKMQGILTTLAVKAPGYGDRRLAILHDLAVITGAKLIQQDSGDTVEAAKLENLGRARRVWADTSNFNIIGGWGDPQAIRDRIAAVKREIPTIKEEYERDKARERLGKLTGGIAVINVGAPTELAQKEKRNRVEGAIAAMRAASENGVVPGGGAAYLAAARAVRKVEVEDEDEAFGLRILANALEAPTRWIVKNAGLEPNAVIAELALRPVGWGYDVIKDEYCDIAEAGIRDPHPVVRTALVKAASGALMAVSTDALIIHKSPDWTADP